MGREINEGTNTEDEALAIMEALRYCRLHNHIHSWLQTYSMLRKNIIDGSWKSPWCIIGHVEKIKQMMEGCIIKVSDICRDWNKLADHLANYALDVGAIECHEFWHVDSQGKRLLNED